MVVLGIESSCDETCAAVVVDGAVRSNVVASQQDHAAYGGVVPELASRLHERHIVTTVAQALTDAGVTLNDLTGVAATYGPGLVGALVVGLNFAKGLASGLGLPLVGIDHMEGHLWANFLAPTSDLFLLIVKRIPEIGLTLAFFLCLFHFFHEFPIQLPFVEIETLGRDVLL